MPKKMLILPGNAELEGNTFPNEEGKTIKWKDGALHWGAAKEYAHLKGYEPVPVNVPGDNQSQTSPQAKAALKAFLEDPDEADTAFYGFSGGGYTLRHILEFLATDEGKKKKLPDMPMNNPEALHRIDLVVVLGAPKRHISDYDSAKYNNLAKQNKSVDPKKWKDLKAWDVVHRTNPTESALPKSGVPQAVVDKLKKEKHDTHMFGPEVLLAEYKNNDQKVDDDWEDLDKDDSKVR